MFIKDNLIKFTRIHLKVLKFFGTCSLSFDVNQRLFVQPGKKATKESTKAALALLYFSVLWVQYFYARKNEGFATGLENLFFAAEFTGLTLVKWLSTKQRRNLAVLFNQFLQFESTQLSGKFHYFKNVYINFCFTAALFNCRKESVKQPKPTCDPFNKASLVGNNQRYSRTRLGLQSS